jgi:Family of unknown function (DUF5906)
MQKQRFAEQLSPDQFAEQMAIDVEKRRKGGGPNLRDEYLERVAQLPKELHREYYSRTIEIWSKVEDDLKPKPAAKMVGGRRYVRQVASEATNNAAQSFSLPAPQPKADPEPRDTQNTAARATAKEIVAAYAGREVPKPKPDEEPEEPEEPETEPEEEPEEEGVTNTQIALPNFATAAKAVAMLNQKHHVIGNYGNRCVILSWELWEINRNVIIPTFQRFEDFKHRYMNRFVWRQTRSGMEKVAAGEFWLKHPNRITYDSIAFRPNQPQVLPDNRLNLWRGFGVFPRKGSWKLMRNHIYRVLAAGDRKAGRYIIRWLAYAVQHPDLVGETVLVLQGNEGTGKGTLARAMLRIFGPHGLPVSQPKHLTGGFSGHLQHCCFLFLDEAFWAGDVQAEGRLKNLVTEDTITIEPKYFTPFQVPNLLHILMSSNNDWVVPAGPHARRYAVFKVSDERMDDFAYFSALRAELDNGGVEAMLFDLLRLDLGNWHPMQIYKTAALTEQKQRSLRGLNAWIETILQEGLLPSGLDAYPNRCYTEDLTAQAKEFDRYTNDVLVTGKLKEILKVEPFGGTKRGWKFPPLLEARAHWSAHFGADWPWQRNISEWQVRRREWRGV